MRVLIYTLFLIFIGTAICCCVMYFTGCTGAYGNSTDNLLQVRYPHRNLGSSWRVIPMMCFSEAYIRKQYGIIMNSDPVFKPKLPTPLVESGRYKREPNAEKYYYC